MHVLPSVSKLAEKLEDTLANTDAEVTFVVRGEGHTARLRKDVLAQEVSPVLLAMVSDPSDDERSGPPRGERDGHGRYILEGPSNAHAFALLVHCVRKLGFVTPAEIIERLPDLDSRLEACRYVDYYLLPGQVKMHLTRVLLSSFKMAELGEELIDVGKLGLCRSEMIMDRIHLEGLFMQGLQLDNSHVRQVTIRRCRLADCELAQSVTADEIHISNSRFEGVQLGVFASKIIIDEDSELLGCNLRVVEELLVRSSTLHNCTFRGSDEDRKDRQMISAAFYASNFHGDVTLPFDKIVCEQTCFHGETMRMTKGGASISLAKSKILSLPSIESETRVNLCIEDCDLAEALHFHRMKLQLRDVRILKPCEFVDVEFVDKVCEITFPRKSRFRQVRFKEGLQDCIASGCNFEGCNLGYGQDAVNACLLTQCHFQACRFPFLESDSPVANFSGSNFVACRIQWSGQFPHEESFVINSYWLRKWNLASSTVSEVH